MLDNLKALECRSTLRQPNKHGDLAQERSSRGSGRATSIFAYDSTPHDIVDCSPLAQAKDSEDISNRIKLSQRRVSRPATGSDWGMIAAGGADSRVKLLPVTDRDHWTVST